MRFQRPFIKLTTRFKKNQFLFHVPAWLGQFNNTNYTFAGLN
jgi:hypothetical protein